MCGWLQEQGWGGWGGWGVGSLLSTASTHVTAGLSTVLETAVGAPDPETLATALRDKQHLEPPESDNTQGILFFRIAIELKFQFKFFMDLLNL